MSFLLSIFTGDTDDVMSDEPPPMLFLGASDALGPRFTELPAHLCYRKPVVPNSFQHVEARYYQQPVKRPPFEDASKKRYESPTKNSPYNTVSTRYLSPAKPQPTGQELNNAARLSPQVSIRATPELALYKRVAAAAGIKNVPSKYFDEWKFQQSNVPQSPRFALERRMKAEAQAQEGRLQRPHVGVGGATTFAEMEKDNPRLRLWNSPPKDKSGRVSIVMAYVKDGVPIPTKSGAPALGTAPNTSPVRAKSPRTSPLRASHVDPFFGGGGAGGGVSHQRTN